MADAATTVRMIVDQAICTANPEATGDQATLLRLAYATGRAAEYARSPRFGPGHEMTIAFRALSDFLAKGTHDAIKARVEASVFDMAA